MQLGQVIRKYRKNKNMTQEEMGLSLIHICKRNFRWRKEKRDYG